MKGEIEGVDDSDQDGRNLFFFQIKLLLPIIKKKVGDSSNSRHVEFAIDMHVANSWDACMSQIRKIQGQFCHIFVKIGKRMFVCVEIKF